MNDELIALLILIFILGCILGIILGCYKNEDSARTYFCKQIYTKTVNYEKCKIHDLRETYKLIKPIDEVK